MPTLSIKPKHLLLVSLLLVFQCGNTASDAAAQETAAVWWRTLPDGCRLYVDSPLPDQRPRTLVIYAAPNGNSIEQTLGCQPVNDSAWRFDIQHAAAQIRRVRQLRPEVSLSLAVLEAPGRSWPAFLGKQPAAPRLVMRLVSYLRSQTEAADVIMCGHSGGGAFLLRTIAAGTVPQWIRRFVFLDASYSWDSSVHASPIMQWLQADPNNSLLSLAYDDRLVELNGRRVVSDDGGTWRATERMQAAFSDYFPFKEHSEGPFRRLSALNGQIQLLLHTNPQNKILHTALVGDMNGLICALAADPALPDAWQKLQQPRDYSHLLSAQPVQVPPKPAIVDVPADLSSPSLPLPPRSLQAHSASQLFDSLSRLSPAEREQVLLQEIQAGNVPERLRQLTPVQMSAVSPQGSVLTAICFATHDCIAVGSPSDSIRVALSVGAADLLARTLHCELLTPSLSDNLRDVATTVLQPQPLTEQRESLATLRQHEELIRAQLLAATTDERLLAGLKKDLVISRQLLKKPGRTALYGWHEADGLPIQPLYAGHSDSYVDYSHGVRLIYEKILVDGQWKVTTEVLADPVLWPLLSREGPLDLREIRRRSGWGLPQSGKSP